MKAGSREPILPHGKVDAGGSGRDGLTGTGLVAAAIVLLILLRHLLA